MDKMTRCSNFILPISPSPTLQIANIPFLRFGNPFIDGMLHKDKVDSVMIELKEEFGCEGRGE